MKGVVSASIFQAPTKLEFRKVAEIISTWLIKKQERNACGGEKTYRLAFFLFFPPSMSEGALRLGQCTFH